MAYRSMSALLLPFMLGGCGAHGKSWVDPSPRSAACKLESESALQWEEPAKPPPRPRLHQVVTLGQSDVPEPEPSGFPQAPPPPPPVVVSVHNTFGPQLGSGAFVPVGGCLHCGRAESPGRVTPRHTGAHLGRDWPAPRDSGPVFPFNAAPADPWGGRR